MLEKINMLNKEKELNHQKKIENSLNKIAKSSMIVLIGVLLSKISLYIYRIIVARYYGPEVYGLFSLAVMILTFFTVLFGFGFAEGLLRFIPFYSGKRQKENILFLFKISKNISLILGLLACTTLFLLSDYISISLFHNSNLSIFLKISSIILPFYILSNMYLATIRSFELIGWYSFILNIFQNLLKLIAIIIFILFAFQSKNIMVSFFIGIFGMFALSYHIANKKIKSLNKKKEKISDIKDNKKSKILKKMLVYSTPLMFSSIFFLIYYWIDSFAIGYLLDTKAVGFYNAVVPIAILLTIIPDLFIQLFYPIITKEYSLKNFNIIKELSKQILKWIFLLILPIFLLMFLFPGAIINILFGKEYLVAENALRILAIGGFISAFSTPIISLLSMAGKSKTILLNMIITSSLNFIFNFIMIRIYGINGAALATSAVWVIFTIILFSQVKSVLGFIPLRRSMIRIFISSIVPLGILLILKIFIPINLITLIILSMFFLAFYFFIMFLTKCFDGNDIAIIKDLRNNFKMLKIGNSKDL
jgi:O-antigen/teichoic acid export membrane protein